MRGGGPAVGTARIASAKALLANGTVDTAFDASAGGSTNAIINAFAVQPDGKVIAVGQAYPGKNFDYHLIPFKAAIAAGAVSIMPYYSIPTGQTSEEVGMAFNREIITDLLRRKLGFTGMVNSDSGITTGMPWGVESLSVQDRYRKAIEAHFNGLSPRSDVRQFPAGRQNRELRIEAVHLRVFSERVF